LVAGDAEIRDLPVLSPSKDVLWLDIPMDYPNRVECACAIRDCAQDCDGLVLVHRCIRQRVGQGAIAKFHDDAEVSVVLERVEVLNDVWQPLPSGCKLPYNVAFPAQQLRVEAESFGNDLDSDPLALISGADEHGAESAWPAHRLIKIN
jgi:hypothetical protein